MHSSPLNNKLRKFWSLLFFTLALFTITPVHADLLEKFKGIFSGKPAENAIAPTEDASPESVRNSAVPGATCPQLMIDYDLLKGYPEACGTGRMPPSIDPILAERSPLAGGWDLYLENSEDVRGVNINFYDLISNNFEQKQLGMATITGYTASVYYLSGALESGWIHGPLPISQSGEIGIYINGSTHVSGKPSDNPDIMVGDWDTGIEKGVAIWRKRPDIEVYKVSAHDAVRVGDTLESRQYTLSSEPVHITAEHPVGCGAAMRGNCQTVKMTIFGKGLDTYHVLWIDPASSMEVAGIHSCHGQAVSNWNTCDQEPFPFPDEVVTLDLTLIMWDGIKPGPRTVWIDGQPIPVYLDINNYPEEEVRPDLESLLVYNVAEQDGSQPVPAVALEEGKSYWLEATYKDKHPDPWVTVDIPMSQTSVKQVVLFKTGDETVFSSDPLRFKPYEVLGEEP